jgi:hypothetical protein
MASTVRVRRHLDSDTIHLPEVSGLVGRDVEITVREITPTAGEPENRYPLRGSVLRYDEPFEPAVEDDWEAIA